MDLCISKLRKYYHNKRILDVDYLNIKKEKITGIIGDNGVGKSTLLNIISGLDKKYQGVVSYDGKKLDREIYKNMTLVFQRPRLFKRSVYENIEYPLKLRKVNKIKRKKIIEKIIKRLKISDIKDNKGHLLSGGESQKVALARAIVFKPKLLLLDEPTSNIDDKSTKLIESEILRYKEKENATVIIITHNKKQAERICDEIITIDNGKVVL
ncbi:MAG: ATP-binding cassette domain-containing protein [Firmicutes bacterium]|nr:ATP-binding cassette domain-containing protein [Bacillota bacterium]